MNLPVLEIFKNAYGKYGVASFNVFNAEQIHGVFGGAEIAKLPVIIQFTPVARNYMTSNFLEAIINAAEEIYPKADYSVHLDHGNIEHCINAIESEFYNSIMIDASHEDYDKNISITSEIVRRAHDKGIAVEAELGLLSGIEDDKNISNELEKYTDPNQVVEFVERTGCDSLAVAVGTSHGAYKLSGGKGIQLDILKEIQQRLPDYPIVLHGASNVPKAEVERINRTGGKIRLSARGIEEKDLLQAIRYGVTKINIATDLRLIWTRVHREYFYNSPELFDPISPGKKYMEELNEFVNQKCKSLVVSPDEN
jgi:fructose-bisphosphate aldolase, class II